LNERLAAERRIAAFAALAERLDALAEQLDALAEQAAERAKAVAATPGGVKAMMSDY
jgi:hypothetical protein